MQANNMILVSYGTVSNDFKTIAQLKKQLVNVKSGMLKQHRVDCYEFSPPTDLVKKFKEELGMDMPKSIEIFNPSDKYPAHKDGGGTSYFIALESGYFYIDGVTYPIVPFVLYAFDDGKLHNTDFCAVMLK